MAGKKRQHKDYEIRTSTLENYQHTTPGYINAIAVVLAVFYSTASKAFWTQQTLTYVSTLIASIRPFTRMELPRQVKCRIKARCVWFLLSKAVELKCSNFEYLHACFTNTDLVLTLNEVFFPRLCWYTWLTSAQKKYCCFSQQLTEISVWARSCEAEFTPRYGLYLEQCHNLTICYTSPSLKSFSYCKLKRCLHWKACRLWIFFHSHKQTYIRYWINTTYKYLFILPYTHYYSQKCLQCTVTTWGLIKTKLCGKHFPTGKHCKTSGHHNVSSPAIPFLIVTFPGILGDGPLELSRSQKNFPKSPLTGQIEILTLESLQSRNPIHKFIKIS